MTPILNKGRLNKRLPALILLELAVSLAAFALSAAVFGLVEVDRALLVGAMGSLFWLGAQLQGLGSHSPSLKRPSLADRSVWVVAIERTWVGAGLNLLLLALFTYVYAGEPGAFELALLGSILAGSLNGLIAARASRKQPGSVLLLGGEPLGVSLAGELKQAVIAVAGDFSGIAGIVESQRPARIVVSLPDKEARALTEELLPYRLAGIEVDGVAELYEKVYLRVCTEGLAPQDLLSSTAFTASRPIMALQATYSNLMGLVLLVTLFPIIALLSVGSRLAAGRGSMLDRVECAGFQGVPFFRLRFRTRHATRGDLTWAGKAIESLGLTSLPQIINIVRGEMAMFGPSPVRREFAEALERRIPLYSRRFSTRPGLLGWAQANMPAGVREATIELEYDLYYIKECSPSLDLEILLRTLLQVPGRMRR